jgi:hypothetical protein
MTEEVKPQEGTEQIEQVEQKPEELSNIEQRALEMGWRPKDEFDGSEDDFIDAKEFVRRKPLFEKIENQSRELKAVRKALDAFKEHYSTVKKTEYERAMTNLKASQKQAVADGDIERYHMLSEAHDNLKEEATKFEKEQSQIQVQDPVAPHPHFVAWVDRNPWYASQAHMRVFADDLGVRLAAQGMNPDEVLKKVEQEVRKEFPTKFRNQNKDNAPDVSGKSNPGRTPKNEEIELTEQERTIMTTLVRGGHITKEKYIADLKAAKGLK